MKKYELTQIDEFTYNIKVNINAKLIYACIKNQLKNIVYDDETKSMFFSAEDVKSLQNYLKNVKMSHQKCIKMISDLSKQINFIKKANYWFYGFDIQDIIVINEDTFVICAGDYLQSLTTTKTAIMFFSPIKIPYFGSPDIITLTNLPGEINNTCVYYSLGALIVYCLLNEYLLKGNEIKSEEEIENILKPLQDTKIYWFLKRCLKTNSEKRVLLLI
jgi:hypothetical protein